MHAVFLKKKKFNLVPFVLLIYDLVHANEMVKQKQKYLARRVSNHHSLFYPDVGFAELIN